MNDQALLRALVDTPSVTGDEATAAAWLATQATKDGFDVTTDGAGNVHIRRHGTGPLIIGLGHIDTVAGEIRVRVKKGELWGRGSVDAKGPLAAFYGAMRKAPEANVLLVACVDEEGASRGARALPTDWDPAALIVLEPSGADGLTIGYKGIVRGTITLERPVVHGAHAEPNALDAFVAIWNAADAEFSFGTGFDDVQGRLDDLRHDTDGLTSRVVARFQMRLPPGTEPDLVKRHLQTLLAGQGANVVIREAVAAVTADGRSRLATRFRAAIRAAGGTPQLKRKTGTSDWNVLAPHYAHVPTVAYGPGDARLDHAPDERIDLAEFARGVQVLTQVLAEFD